MAHQISIFMKKDEKIYEAGMESSPISIPAGETREKVTYLFMGPKKLDVLADYGHQWKVSHFDLALDFGYFYFLTKPMFIMLSFLKNLLGSFGLAILAMTVLMKAVFFPLSLRSYRSVARLKKFQAKTLFNRCPMLKMFLCRISTSQNSDKI